MPITSEARSKPIKTDAKPDTKQTLRGQLKRFTRERLITVAMNCFAQDGFSATSVERIVELAGTTAPTFYRHFESKNDLLKPMQATLARAVRAEIGKLDEIALTFETIRQWLEEFAAMWRQMHRLCSAYWEACALDAELSADTLPSSLATAGELQNLMARCPDEAARIATRMRIALIIPLLDRVIQTTEALEDAKLRDGMRDEFARMLLLTLQDCTKS